MLLCGDFILYPQSTAHVLSTAGGPTELAAAPHGLMWPVIFASHGGSKIHVWGGWCDSTSFVTGFPFLTNNRGPYETPGSIVSGRIFSDGTLERIASAFWGCMGKNDRAPMGHAREKLLNLGGCCSGGSTRCDAVSSKELFAQTKTPLIMKHQHIETSKHHYIPTSQRLHHGAWRGPHDALHLRRGGLDRKSADWVGFWGGRKLGFRC